MPNHVNVQINHCVQTNTQQVVQTQVTKPTDIIKLISKKEFCAIFYANPPQFSQDTGIPYLINPDLFWDHLFGHIGWAVQHGQNKKATFLTEESTHVILQHYEKFVSGFDFYHRPNGFYMEKNPLTGIVDVLHYSQYLHTLQKTSLPNNLAINIDSPDADIPSTHPFTGHQKDWYETLQQKRSLTETLVTCTEQELRSAFIQFSSTLEKLGLEFYPPNFSESFFNRIVNPVVLLARWETVLCNRHLKESDRSTQWEVILNLSLEDSQGAIRALSDYENDVNPCGILLPYMELTSRDFLDTSPINSSEEGKNCWGFRSVINPKQIKDEKDFWRYVAFQPHRHSEQFYRQTLQSIKNIGLISENSKLQLMKLLASATTGFNAAHNTTEERDMQLVWDEMCSIINRWETMNPAVRLVSLTMDDNRKAELRNKLVYHLCRLDTPPNIFWLNMILGHIKHFFSTMFLNFNDAPLEELSNSLNTIVGALKINAYKGAKFWCQNNKWISEGIKGYVELQESLCITGNTIHKHLAAYLSTFNITDTATYLLNIATLTCENDRLFIFTLKILEDIQTNNGLNWAQLYRICQAINQHEFNTELEVLNYLERHLGHVFKDNYFSMKRQEVSQAQDGLNIDMLRFIDELNFSSEQATSVKLILTQFKANNPLLESNELEDLAMKLNDFTQVFTSSDITNFLSHLAEMMTSITDIENMKNFLGILMEERKFTDFERIYFRNKIIQNNQNLLEKFSSYIFTVSNVIENWSQLNPVCLQTMLADFILNTNLEDEQNDILEEILNTLETIIKDNPHVQDYIFQCLENIPGLNTTEFIPNMLECVRTLKITYEILHTQDVNIQIQNMQVFYSLLAKYANAPEAFIRILETLKSIQSDENKIQFIIKLMSRLLEKNYTLENIQIMVEYILTLNPQQYAQFQTCYQHPPYAPLEQWMEWSRDQNTLLNKYDEFTILPFGPRKREYGFNLRQYHTQKTLFKGLISNGQAFSPDIFTDELGQNLESTLNENRQKSIPDLKQIFATACEEKNTIALLCAAIELLARTTAQKDLTIDTFISQEINTTQVMTLYAALTHPHTKLQIEMLTGEGKSRVMMLLAACKTSLGLTTDFITSDFQLAERDYFTYKSFFNTLDISTSLIGLSTPELLYQHKGVNFSDNEQLQLIRNKSDIDGHSFAYLDPNPECRNILIDEIDKFKKDKSKYACNYATQSIKFREFSWVYSHLVQFMQREEHRTSELLNRSDYENKVDVFLRYLSTHDADPIRVGQLSALHHSFPKQISTWLHSADIAIKRMQENIDYAITEDQFPVQDGDGNFHMSKKLLVLNNGRPAQGAMFSDGLHQCLLALLNIQAGNDDLVMIPEVETQRTSFPISFMSKYEEGHILGASGTTRSAAPIANSAINYENYGYLIAPRERPLKRENKNIWLAADHKQQIEFIKCSIQKKLAQGLPTLIICKDDTQSLALFNALSEDPELEDGQFTRVHGLSTSEEEKIAIKQAGQANQITFSTAGMFSRGVDIDADYLSVIASYIPTLEDEIQIMGRTGRAGKPGEYQMIPDLSHEDTSINGNTYNIYNEVDKYQNQLALEAEFQEDVSVIYALFLEEITQSFFQTRPPESEKLEMWLLKWQDFLNNMQKNWENNSDTLLGHLNNQEKQQFLDKFSEFTTTWKMKLKEDFPYAPVDNESPLQDKVSKIYESAVQQISFFKPKRQEIKAQHAYDPSDDGQARIYDTLFAKTRACLSGERRWFADYHAWREGRGALFPNLMATLNGERPLFADLIATIKRWLKELKEFYETNFIIQSPAHA